MKGITMILKLGLLVCVFVAVTGCGIWPVMTESNGRQPLAMGKSDQILSPWATQPVHLNENYGRSYRYAVEKQILHPQAAQSLELVEGMDGTTGQLTMERYQLMFKEPPFTVTGGALSEGGGTE